MEKTLLIDGKEVRFKASGGFVYRYRAQFGKDVLDILMPLLKAVLPLVANKGESDEINVEEVIELIEKVEGVEIVDLYNVIWVLAKTADDTVPEPSAWFDSFETFPIADIAGEILSLLAPTLLSRKDIKKKLTQVVMKK